MKGNSAMRKIYRVKDFKIDESNMTLQETIFHNANGYIGVRGTLEEGCPDDMDTMRGTYLNGFYDIVPMKQAEKLCNLVEEKETIVNVADTQTLNLDFAGQHFSMFEGDVLECERMLDMEKGITRRKVKWLTGQNQEIDFDIRRMASFEDTSLFTIDYRFTSKSFSGEMKIRSSHKGLVKNYFNPRDPRLAGESFVHLEKKDALIAEGSSYLVSQTVRSKLQAASGVAHEIYVNGEIQPVMIMRYSPEEHRAEGSLRLELKPGDEVRIVKYSVFADSIRSADCLSRVRKGLAAVQENKIDYYYAKQKLYLEKFWQHSTMEIVGDDDLNASVCFNMYSLLQAAGSDGYSSIAAKGLSGEGYEGHYFWDTEMFMLPYFVLTNPEIAQKLLDYRYKTLDYARENAALLGHKRGALYPWRTINGQECSGYFPSGTAQYHIDGDISYAVVLYYIVTGDWEFIKEKGAEILLETGRLWMDVGNYAKGRFMINCVTGPDEYTCMVNNNYYTNAAAKYNLEWLTRFAEKFQAEQQEWEAFKARTGLTDIELEKMKQAAMDMYMPYDEKLGINPQDDSFLQKPVWDLSQTAEKDFPLLLHYHPLHLYRYQVCKQADTVLAHYLFPEYQDQETIRKSFLYYENITTHDSSLSTCVFSIIASMLGMVDKAYEYFGDSAKLDLMNTHKNTKDGIHAANMGGCYMAIVHGFAMLRIYEDYFSIAPVLPEAWEKYSFRFCYQTRLIQLRVTAKESSVELLEGSAVVMEFYGHRYDLQKGQRVIINQKDSQYAVGE